MGVRRADGPGQPRGVSLLHVGGAGVGLARGPEADTRAAAGLMTLQTATLRVATANLDGWRRANESVRADALRSLGLDVVCAQELTAARFRALLSALGDAWWGVHSLTSRPGLPAPSRYWGVAGVGRPGKHPPPSGARGPA